MGASVLVMRPILRFLQLLCENHNRDLQVSEGLAQACLAPTSSQPASLAKPPELTSSRWV